MVAATIGREVAVVGVVVVVVATMVLGKVAVVYVTGPMLETAI